MNVAVADRGDMKTICFGFSCALDWMFVNARRGLATWTWKFCHSRHIKIGIYSMLAIVASGAFADTPNLAYDIWPKGKVPLAMENPKPEGIEPIRDDVVRLSNVSVPQVVVTPVVGAELHVFKKGGRGGHGYGVRRLGFPTDAWPALAEEWLELFK